MIDQNMATIITIDPRDHLRRKLGYQELMAVDILSHHFHQPSLHNQSHGHLLPEGATALFV